MNPKIMRRVCVSRSPLVPGPWPAIASAVLLLTASAAWGRPDEPAGALAGAEACLGDYQGIFCKGNAFVLAVRGAGPLLRP